MSQVHAILSNPRRIVAALVVLVAAALLAAAFIVEPEQRSTVSEPGMGVRETGTSVERDAAVSAVQERTIGATADAAGAAVPEGAADASLLVESATPAIDAKIVRTGTIALRLADGTFETGWSDVQATAGAFGGYVVSASRSGVLDGPRAGSITMRVPTKRFDAAVDQLRDVKDAKVERLDVASEDVTQEFVDVRARLKHDRAVEARLLSLLAKTDGVSEVLAVQARLDRVQEEIEISKGRMQYLEKMTSMSTIEVALRERGAGTKDDEQDESVLGAAWGDASERFTENIAAAIVWTGGALPTLVLLAIIGGAARVIWRRTRVNIGSEKRADPAS